MKRDSDIFDPSIGLNRKTELRRIDWLRPNPNNARVHSEQQVEFLCRLIKRFGWTNPILANAEGLIIAGHCRRLAALAMGLKKVPVIVVTDLSEAELRAYTIADNQSALLSTWDEDILRSEISSLKLAEFDLDMLGFTEEELDDILDEDARDDIDATPPPPIRAKTKPGDLVRLGDHILLCGDSTKEKDLMRLMNGQKAEMIWTDPPFNVNYDGPAASRSGKGKIKNDSMSPAEFEKFLVDAFTCFGKFLDDGGAIYVAHADTNRKQFLSAWDAAGLKLSSVLVWRKNSLVLGRSDYHWQHEPILYGWKPGKSHRWYGGRKQSSIQEFAGEFFHQVGEDEWSFTLHETTFVITGKDLKVREEVSSVIYENKPQRSPEHPTMKPVALIVRAIKNSSRRGQIVLEPFGGSGSTLMACEEQGRCCRIIELDPRFCDVIITRWEEFTGKKAKKLV